MVEIDETEDENDGWPKVTENQTNHVFAAQQGSTMTSRSRNVNNRHNENDGSRRIKHLFLVSRKIILQNHASRLLWKSRFTRKKKPFHVSRFTRKKKAKYSLQHNSIPMKITRALYWNISKSNGWRLLWVKLNQWNLRMQKTSFDIKIWNPTELQDFAYLLEKLNENDNISNCMLK